MQYFLVLYHHRRIQHFFIEKVILAYDLLHFFGLSLPSPTKTPSIIPNPSSQASAVFCSPNSISETLALAKAGSKIVGRASLVLAEVEVCCNRFVSGNILRGN